MVYEIERGDARVIRRSPAGTTKPLVVVFGTLPPGIAASVGSAATIVEYGDSTSWNDGLAAAICDRCAFSEQRCDESQNDDVIRHGRLQAVATATCVEVVPLLHSAAQPVAQVAILHAADRPNVSMVAHWLGRSTRTLERTFVDGQLPPPRGLIRLARWLVFARSTERIGASPPIEARLAGFATVASFYKGLVRELGLRASDLHGPTDLYAHLRNSLLASYGIGRELGPVRRVSGDARTR